MDWTQFNWVDWAFFAALLYGAALGAVRGLSSELATLIGMVVAVIVTRLFYEPVSFWVCERWGWNEQITRLFAVVLLALLALYGMRLLRIALGAMMTFSFKGLVERVGGLLAGFFRLGVIALVLLLAASFVPSSTLQRAVMYDSAVGRQALPLLVAKYNELAAKAAMLPAEIPIGVEPQTILPPLPEDGKGFLQAEPMFPTDSE
ncbi:MAG TPA: CvpA family protein [Kiritimatiellia bacterium]|nr:CvpA family protein [Kiritimatiellia bacterium]